MTDDQITALIASTVLTQDAHGPGGLWTMDLRPKIGQTITVEAPDEATARSLISVENVVPMFRDHQPELAPDVQSQIADLQQTVADLSTTVQDLQNGTP